MEEKTRFIRIAAAIGVFLVLLAQNSISIFARAEKYVDLDDRIYLDMHGYIYMPLNTTIKSGMLKKKEYEEAGKHFAFIKNLSLSDKQSTCAKDIIVVDSEYEYRIEKNWAYICFYSDVCENKVLKKEHVLRTNMDKNTKSIFILPHGMHKRDTVMNRIETAENKNSSKIRQLELGLECTLQIISLAICKEYARSLETDSRAGNAIRSYESALKTAEIKEEDLERVALRSPNACSLFGRVMRHNAKRDLIKLQEIFKLCETVVSKIVERNGSDSSNNSHEEFKFETEAETLIKKITYIKNTHARHTIEQIEIILIDMLTHGNLQSDIKRAKYRLQKEAKLLGTDPRTLFNSRMTMHQIIDKANLKKKTAPWNKEILDMLITRLLEKTVTKNTSSLKNEKAQLIEDIKKKIQDCYNGYRNIAILKSMFNTEIAQIIEILRIRKDRLYNESEKNIVTDENSCIVDILAKMAIHHTIPHDKSVEQKKKIVEMKTKILSLLNEIEKESILLAYIDKRLKKANSNMQRMCNLVFRKVYFDIHNIKDPHTPAELARKKRQKIVDLLFKSLFATTHTDAMSMEKQIKQVVDIIADVLASERLNCPPHKKMLADIKEEIRKEETAYLTSNNQLTSICDLLETFEYKTNKHIHFDWGTNTLSCKISAFIKDLRTNKDAGKWIMEIAKDPTLNKMRIFYQVLCNIYNHIDDLRSYSEIWKDPVFLVLNTPNSNSEDANKLLGTITYKSERDGEVCKKEIEFTEHNLKAFEEARRPEDIDAIEGKTICICNE